MHKTKPSKTRAPATQNYTAPSTDTSPYVFQRDKYKGDLTIRELPWTEKQKAIINLVMHKDTKCVFLKGPAGTAKTLTSMYCGLQMLTKKRISDIVLVRAAVESSDAKLGFLPGSVEDKISQHMLAFQDKLVELLPKSQIAALENDSRIVACPLSYARGLHFPAKFVCVDEAQNMSIKESLLILSRIGEFSKVMVCGDSEQSDLPRGKSGFVDVYNLFDNVESQEQGIYCVELGEEDIVRSEFCKYITRKFKELKEAKEVEKAKIVDKSPHGHHTTGL